MKGYGTFLTTIVALRAPLEILYPSNPLSKCNDLLRFTGVEVNILLFVPVSLQDIRGEFAVIVKCGLFCEKPSRANAVSEMEKVKIKKPIRYHLVYCG